MDENEKKEKKKESSRVLFVWPSELDICASLCKVR